MTSTSSGPIRLALVGCGSIAHKHVAAISRIDDLQITGVYDVNLATARAFGGQYGLPVYDTPESLVQRADPHAFSILTPSGAHADTVLDLMRFERSFIVEKPLALRLADIDEILTQCMQRDLRIYVVKQNRFNPPLRQLKRAIDAGRFGRMVMGTVRIRWTRDQNYYDQCDWRGTWQHDGGVLTNQASHHIDALLWLMGAVDTVNACTATRLVDIEAEDTGAAVLQFRNGALGIIEATTATRPHDLEGSISVLGEKGSVEVGGFFMNELKTWNFSEPHAMDETVWQEHATVPNERGWNHTEFYRDVVDSLRTGKRGLVDGLEGRKSIELITAIYESAALGEQVALQFQPRACRLGTGRPQVLPTRRAA